MARFNAAVVGDMRADAAFRTAKNPNLAGRIAAADYVFPFPAGAYDFAKGLTIDYVKKGERVTENAADRIFAAGEREGKMLLTLAAGNVTLRPDRVFVLTLAAGNVTLRPDRVFGALKRELGAAAEVFDVVKTEQYIGREGVLVPVPDTLREE